MKLESAQLSPSLIQTAREAVKNNSVSKAELDTITEAALQDGKLTDEEATFIANLDNQALINQLKALPEGPAANQLSFNVNDKDKHLLVGNKFEAITPLRTPEARINSYLERAKTMSKAGKSDEAETLLNRALRLDPQNVEVMRQLSLIAGEKQDYAKVLDLSNQILAVDPDNYRALNNRARANLDLGHPAQAIVDFEKAASLATGQEKKWIESNLRQAKESLHNLADSPARQAAMAELRAELGQHPQNVTLMHELSLLAAQEKDFAQVKALSDSILAIDPTHYRALNNRGLAQIELGQPAAALPDLQKSLELAPPEDRGWITAGIHKAEKAIKAD